MHYFFATRDAVRNICFAPILGLSYAHSFIPRPVWMSADLSGEWVGEMQSQWKAVLAAAPLGAIPTSLDLHQGWKEVVLALKADKMRSRSTGAVPIYDPIT